MATNGFVNAEQIGYLSADPSFKRNSDGSTVVNFRLLTNLTYLTKSKEKVDETVGIFYELWGQSAENFASFMKSGMRVHVNAEIRNDRYEKDGKEVFRDRYRVTRWLSLTKKDGGDSVGGEGSDYGSAPHENP